MRDACTARKVAEIQVYADHIEWKNFFPAINAVCSPPTKATASHFSADGRTLLIEKTQILQRLAGHSTISTMSDAAIARLPQMETNTEFDLHETIRGLQQHSREKAPDRARSLLRSTSMVTPNSWII
ncbi:hypothetical protein SprV_0702362300 [Sparganum proliferum]